MKQWACGQVQVRNNAALAVLLVRALPHAWVIGTSTGLRCVGSLQSTCMLSR